MIRSIGTVFFALLIGAPGFLKAQQSPGDLNRSGLRLMNNSQFNRFLEALDTDVIGWKSRLKAIDVGSLKIDHQEKEEINQSYNLCLQALDNTREDIQKLSQKQTLKLDFLLSVDLNELARNLDGLSGNLGNLVPVQEPTTAKKSIGWVREVLAIDKALAPHIAEFQQHVLALAGLIDAALENAEQNPEQSQNRK